MAVDTALPPAILANSGVRNLLDSFSNVKNSLSRVTFKAAQIEDENDKLRREANKVKRELAKKPGMIVDAALGMAGAAAGATVDVALTRFIPMTASLPITPSEGIGLAGMVGAWYWDSPMLFEACEGPVYAAAYLRSKRAVEYAWDAAAVAWASE